ncbi:adenylosuccinate lyase [archaeon]|nr:adenylosuccinate lyase [archaeon]
MAIHPIDFRYGSAEMKSIFEQESRLQKFLDVEAALARAHADVGNIPKSAAVTITKKANTKFVKVSRVKAIEKRTKHDLMAVVKALSEVTGPAGKHVHLGATSYDIVDTANALQFKEALAIVERDLKALEKTLKNLAKKHINTVAVGRTHGQHAIPITYGLKFALWATEIGRHIERVNESKKRVLVGKMSGAVGTQASFGKNGIRIQKLVMKDLGLASAEVSNQIVQRDRYAELISLLALIAATLDKIAKEVRNLSRTEILELSEKFEEKGQVGSSTMPHKRNPINAENICGLSRVIKSNVFVALENVSLEHERDLTNSSSERVIIPESFILLDEILKRTNNVMKNIVLYPENIKRNLEMTGGMEMAEAIMMGLTKKGVGRQEAHELLRKLSIKAVKGKKSLKEVLTENATIKKHLSESEIDWIIDPQNYIGTAVEQVKNVTGR